MAKPQKRRVIPQLVSPAPSATPAQPAVATTTVSQVHASLREQADAAKRLLGPGRRMYIKLSEEINMVSFKKLLRDNGAADAKPHRDQLADPDAPRPLPGAPREGGRPTNIFSSVIQRLERAYVVESSGDSDASSASGRGAEGGASDDGDGASRSEQEEGGEAGNRGTQRKGLDMYDFDDDFIDDTELIEYYGGDRRKAKVKGFFVNKGEIEREEAQAPRALASPRPLKKKAAAVPGAPKPLLKRKATGDEGGEGGSSLQQKKPRVMPSTVAPPAERAGGVIEQQREAPPPASGSPPSAPASAAEAGPPQPLASPPAVATGRTSGAAAVPQPNNSTPGTAKKAAGEAGKASAAAIASLSPELATWLDRLRRAAAHASPVAPMEGRTKALPKELRADLDRFAPVYNSAEPLARRTIISALMEFLHPFTSRGNLYQRFSRGELPAGKGAAAAQALAQGTAQGAHIETAVSSAAAPQPASAPPVRTAALSALQAMPAGTSASALVVPAVGAAPAPAPAAAPISAPIPTAASAAPAPTTAPPAAAASMPLPVPPHSRGGSLAGAALAGAAFAAAGAVAGSRPSKGGATGSGGAAVRSQPGSPVLDPREVEAKLRQAIGSRQQQQQLAAATNPPATAAGPSVAPGGGGGSGTDDDFASQPGGGRAGGVSSASDFVDKDLEELIYDHVRAKAKESGSSLKSAAGRGVYKDVAALFPPACGVNDVFVNKTYNKVYNRRTSRRAAQKRREAGITRPSTSESAATQQPAGLPAAVAGIASSPAPTRATLAPSTSGALAMPTTFNQTLLANTKSMLMAAGRTVAQVQAAAGASPHSRHPSRAPPTSHMQVAPAGSPLTLRNLSLPERSMPATSTSLSMLQQSAAQQQAHAVPPASQGHAP